MTRFSGSISRHHAKWNALKFSFKKFYALIIRRVETQRNLLLQKHTLNIFQNVFSRLFFFFVTEFSSAMHRQTQSDNCSTKRLTLKFTRPCSATKAEPIYEKIIKCYEIRSSRHRLTFLFKPRYKANMRFLSHLIVTRSNFRRRQKITLPTCLNDKVRERINYERDIYWAAHRGNDRVHCNHLIFSYGDITCR